MREGISKNKETPLLAANGSLIELRQVVKKFHNASGEFTVLKDVNAAFQAGEFTSIVGRSGSGKSTLLNMITGIDHPTSGSVRVGNCILSAMDEGSLSTWRGKTMGIVFQFFQLLPMLTLLENTMLPMDFSAVIPAAARETRAKALLERVGLAGLEHKFPSAVSGGQQQSAAVARALANDPPILVADEPTGNLDSRTAEQVLEIFEEQAAMGKTVLMVTHDAVLARRAQRVIVISDGQLIPEAVSKAFAGLPHERMLELSRSGRFQRYTPREVIFTGSGPDLLLVLSGSIDIVANGLWRTQVVIGRLQAGDFFSRADRDLSRAHFAGLRAVGEVEALVIDRLPNRTDLDTALFAMGRSRQGLFRKAALTRGQKGLLHEQ